MQNKKEEMKKLTSTELEQVSGGTTKECAYLATVLELSGYGVFTKVNNDRDDLVDLEALQNFFASKGYNATLFVDGVHNNYFQAPDGLYYDNEYIKNLIIKKQI